MIRSGVLTSEHDRVDRQRHRSQKRHPNVIQPAAHLLREAAASRRGANNRAGVTSDPLAILQFLVTGEGGIEVVEVVRVVGAEQAVAERQDDEV